MSVVRGGFVDESAMSECFFIEEEDENLEEGADCECEETEICCAEQYHLLLEF